MDLEPHLDLRRNQIFLAGHHRAARQFVSLGLRSIESAVVAECLTKIRTSTSLGSFLPRLLAILHHH